MNRIINLLLSVFVVFGITSIPTVSKANIINKISQETPLVLQHSDSIFMADPFNVELAWHSSHQSHYSHSSHESHYSHQSHYSHYSGY